MKRNIYLVLIIALFAASCGSGKKDNTAALNDKKGDLQELKSQAKRNK